MNNYEEAIWWLDDNMEQDTDEVYTESLTDDYEEELAFDWLFNGPKVSTEWIDWSKAVYSAFYEYPVSEDLLPAENRLELAIGDRVMLVMNRWDHHFGDMGTITSVLDDTVEILFDSGEKSLVSSTRFFVPDEYDEDPVEYYQIPVRKVKVEVV